MSSIYSQWKIKSMLKILLVISYCGNFILSLRILDQHPETYLSTTDLANKYGYPLEIHEVTTVDGYILSMQRIPHGKNGSTQNQKVVLVLHGLLGQSDHFILNGRHNGSLAYLLADNGYDVWLGNCRGTGHGRRHVNLMPDQVKFWNFSWHEMGKYDLPATIDYILLKTKKQRLFYVAHSQGCTSLLVLCTERPDYQKKIIVAALLSPSVFMAHIGLPIGRTLARAHKMLMEMVERYNMYEFPNIENSISNILTTLCVNSPFDKICLKYLEITKEGNDPDMLPLLFRFIPTVSSKQVIHFMQGIITDKFQQFDYGTKIKNMEMYGRPEPPEYHIENITVPVAIYYSMGDNMVTYKDVRHLCNKLPKCEKFVRMKSKVWTHLDFIFSVNVGKQLNVPVLRFMQRYNEN